jgi:hypothetical protein
MDSSKLDIPITLETAGKGKPQPATASSTQSSVEETRRSQRVLLRVRAQVHVALNGKAVTMEVFTLSVNSHGALVIIKEMLPVDTLLVLEHGATRECVACKVMRAPRDTPEGFHTAIGFDSPSPDFWKIAFPPTNWRADDT